MVFDTADTVDRLLEPFAVTRNWYCVAVTSVVMLWVMLPPAGTDEPITAAVHVVNGDNAFSTVYVNSSFPPVDEIGRAHV